MSEHSPSRHYEARGDALIPSKGRAVPRDSAALDQQLKALSHRHRRHVLTVLLDRPGRVEPVGLGALTTGAVDDERFVVALHHNHLPMLDQAGYIEWQREADLIRPGPAFDEIATLLDRLPDEEHEFSSGRP